MRIPVITLAFLSVIFPTASNANASTLKCAEAIGQGDTERIQEISKDLLRTSGGYMTSVDQELAERCILEATGEAHKYVPRSGSFVKQSELEKEETNARIEAEVQEIEREKANQAVDDKSRQQQEVVNRLIDGCNAMYERDPDQTITNKLCLDVFLEAGLPD